jgi:hypothetical protein
VSLPDPNEIPLPSVTLQIVASLGRTVMTAAAAWMVGAGLLDKGQTAAFISIGLGVLTGALSIGWSWWEKNHVHAVATAAVAQAKAS